MRWAKLKTNREDCWYMLNSDGDLYKFTVHYVDKNGTIRGRKGLKDRKLKRVVKKTKCHRTINVGKKRVVVKINMDRKNTVFRTLGNLVLETFTGPRPNPWAIDYIDGDFTNCKLENLKWVPRDDTKLQYNTRAYRAYKEYVKVDKVRYFRVPVEHPLYQRYATFIDNREETRKLIKKFLKKEHIKSRLVKVGYETRIYKNKNYKEVKVPYFHINDKNPNFIKHDKEILGSTLLKRKKDDYYPIRINSNFMSRWEKLLKDNDFTILEPPTVSEYILENDVCLARSFAFYNNDLYVRIEAKSEFRVDKDLIEVKGIKF